MGAARLKNQKAGYERLQQFGSGIPNQLFISALEATKTSFLIRQNEENPFLIYINKKSRHEYNFIRVAHVYNMTFI